MKFKLTSSILILIILSLSLASAMTPQGISPNDATSVDDVAGASADNFNILQELFPNIFAITPAIGSDTTYNPNDVVKFAVDPGSVTRDCPWGYLILEIYRKTDANGDNGQLYKALKDDGHANVKAGATPNAFFSFTLPSDSVNEHWSLISYFTCGNTIDSVVSSASQKNFQVVPETVAGVCKTAGQVTGTSCFDNKVLQTYVANDCTQQQKTIAICPSTASCQKGACQDTTKTCASAGGHVCTSGQTCNGDIIPVQETGCCSVTCASVLACYSDSNCASGEYCALGTNTCAKKEVPATTTPTTTTTPSDGTCCYLALGGTKVGSSSSNVFYFKSSGPFSKCIIRASPDKCSGLTAGDGKVKDPNTGEVRTATTDEVNAEAGNPASPSANNTNNTVTPVLVCCYTDSSHAEVHHVLPDACSAHTILHPFVGDVASEDKCSPLRDDTSQIRNVETGVIQEVSNVTGKVLAIPIGIAELNSSTSTQITLAECDTNADCGTFSNYTVTCGTSETIKNVDPQFWSRIFGTGGQDALGIKGKGLCTYNDVPASASGFDIMAFFSNLGQTGTILLIGGVVLVFMALLFRK